MSSELAEKLRVLLGMNVRRLRHARGYSQGELARKANLSREYISYIETRGENASIASLASLAEALEVDVRELFCPREEWPEDSEV